MKKSLLTICSILISGWYMNSQAQTADLQLIHNAADPAASTVDVYVNGTLALDDFAFRSATPFISLPAGVLLNVGVAPGGSTSVNDTLKNFPLTLTAGDRYVAVANGVLNPANFAANPDAVPTAFNVFIKNGVQATSGLPTNVDFVVVHGSSDAPTVDVLARNVATLVDNASYSNITNYITVPAASYILDVTPGNNNTTIVASYEADLSTLGGGAAVVVASGFLDPTANQNGPAFGLWAYLADGTAIQLPSISQARLQVIHNAADPAASTVDVYVNGTLTLNDFAFRTATPFIDIPAGVALNLGVAPGTSTSVADTIKNFEVTLANGNSYIAVANGVLNPANFAANPDGTPTGFTLFLQDAMRESALTATDVDFRVVHGSSDAPTVDVLARNVATLVDNASYSNITNYITVPAASYILDVTPGNNNTTIVASYEADLSTLGGGAAVVVASGFLDPTSNQNGPSFGLWAYLADGTAIQLPSISQARLQVIHNAADPAASTVDVYVNGTLTLNDFAFRTATPFIDIPAGVALNIGVAPGTSTSVADTIKNFEVTLANGNSYIAVANGVLNPANFAANPDGTPTGFTLFLQDAMRESALTATDVDFRVIHGSSDAPTVDVLARNVATLVDNASYSNITNYITVPAASYILDVTPGNNNSVIVASFLADISTLGGGAGVVLASGFLDPSLNQNGPGFGLLLVSPDGTATLLSNVTGINDNIVESNILVYPNPASDKIFIRNGKTDNNILSVRLTDITGRVIESISSKGEETITVNLNGKESGTYLLIVETTDGIFTKRISVN